VYPASPVGGVDIRCKYGGIGRAEEIENVKSCLNKVMLNRSMPRLRTCPFLCRDCQKSYAVSIATRNQV